MTHPPELSSLIRGPCVLVACSAYFSLQLRHNLPDTACAIPSSRSLASSPGLSNHCAQTEQIGQATVGSPTREGDERIRLGDIGPIDGHRGQRSVVVGLEDAVLTPGLVDGHELERAPSQRVKGMGDLENLMRSRALTSI